MNKEEIKKILPHRDPMLLLDEVKLVGGVSVGKYTVKGDEFFLQGHFPGNPVVPGVILCEMLGQSACLLVSGDNPDGEPFTPYFTGMKNVKFKNKVLPGDTITLKSELTAQKGAFYFIKAEGSVDGKLAVTGELSFAVVK
ncbi:MAG: 3-hydroxyacyl-ACP dehydratase FabZ [Oscillospiraceae bacterium]|nr:3-hydroxyacyl-ACP dehydratase FabZ [Oscillospiraceae bacterium]